SPTPLSTLSLHDALPISSPKASLFAQHHRRFGSDAKEVRELEVPSVSVGSLVKRLHGERLHLLQVDTEGMDYQILKWFFDAHVRSEEHTSELQSRFDLVC